MVVRVRASGGLAKKLLLAVNALVVVVVPTTAKSTNNGLAGDDVEILSLILFSEPTIPYVPS